MKLSVVIPFYNEAGNVSPLHKRLKEALASACNTGEYEIIYVDDGSTDGTLPELEKVQAGDPTVVVVSLRRNFGQTAALAAGFDLFQGDVLITMDGDLQNDPKDIPLLLDAVKDCDLVSGWRQKRQDPLLSRRIPSTMANWIISFVTGVKLHDYGCSLKAYNRDVIKNLRLYGEMHRFIPAVASWYGVKVAEVAVDHHPRTQGKSKYGLSRTVRVVLDLLTVKFLQSFSTRPIQFFGPLGIVTGLMGFIILLYLSFIKLVLLQSIGGRPLLLLGALLIIVGIQFIGMGLISEILVRIYHESQQKPIYAIKKIIGTQQK